MSAALDCAHVLKCSVHQHCVLIVLSVCGAFSVFVRENMLCFLESTCQNRFLSPVVCCRMVVSDQRSQPTVEVQNSKETEVQKRSPHRGSACASCTDLPEKFGKCSFSRSNLFHCIQKSFRGKNTVEETGECEGSCFLSVANECLSSALSSIFLITGRLIAMRSNRQGTHSACSEWELIIPLQLSADVCPLSAAAYAAF